MLEAFDDLFVGWSAKESRMSNRGIAEVFTTGWHTYPEESMVANVKEGGWITWLDERCSELGYV